MYCAYQCSQGYKAAKARFEEAASNSERNRWKKTMDTWHSRWMKAAKEFE